MFSGTLTDQPAIAYDPTAAVGARYTYDGDTASQVVVVGNGVTQAANVNLKDLETWLNTLDQVITTLSVPGVRSSDPAVRTVVCQQPGDINV